MSNTVIDNCFVLCYVNAKNPIGDGWGKHPLSAEEVARRRINNPKLNLGVLLGRSTGIIDVECDSEDATSNLQALLGDGLAQCPSWRSKRGRHYLFLYDARLAALVGVVKYQGIEFRLGNDGQTQSIIPPSVVEGVQREWINDLTAC